LRSLVEPKPRAGFPPELAVITGCLAARRCRRHRRALQRHPLDRGERRYRGGRYIVALAGQFLGDLAVQLLATVDPREERQDSRLPVMPTNSVT
jgi:hypothetical protein